jgi:hypothetical protein
MEVQLMSVSPVSFMRAHLSKDKPWWESEFANTHLGGSSGMAAFRRVEISSGRRLSAASLAKRFYVGKTN